MHFAAGMAREATTPTAVFASNKLSSDFHISKSNRRRVQLALESDSNQRGGERERPSSPKCGRRSHLFRFFIDFLSGPPHTSHSARAESINGAPACVTGHNRCHRITIQLLANWSQPNNRTYLRQWSLFRCDDYLLTPPSRPLAQKQSNERQSQRVEENNKRITFRCL